MRIACATALLLFSLFVQAQKNTPFDTTLWNVRYEKALADAIGRGQPLLIVFSGSDWCKPCIKLHENVLVTPRFSAWAKDSAVLLSVDFPRQKKNALAADQVAHNEKVAEKYNPNGVFPLVLVLSGDESIRGQILFHDEPVEAFISNLKEITNTTK